MLNYFLIIVYNADENYHVSFGFLYMINKLVGTHLFCKFSENNLPTLQGVKKIIRQHRGKTIVSLLKPVCIEPNKV